MAKTAAKGFTYRSYNFVNKDPVIDTLRTIVAKEGVTYSNLHKISGVSATTLTSWFDGKTRRPQFATIAAVSGALGYETQFRKVKKIDYPTEVAIATEEILKIKERLERQKTRGVK